MQADHGTGTIQVVVQVPYFYIALVLPLISLQRGDNGHKALMPVVTDRYALYHARAN